MNRLSNGVPLVTTPAPKVYEVPLDDGTSWTGTKRQLLASHPDWLPYAREVQHVTRDVLVDEEQDFYDDPPTRLPTSARKLNPLPGQRTRYEYRPEITIPRRRSAQTEQSQRTTETVPAAQQKRQRRGFFAHPLLYLGVGMVFMLALWVGIQWLGNWWSLHQDDVTYGRPRTFQLDAVVGHADSAANPTHIIIVNLSRHIVIIELPGGNPSKASIYSGPTLFGEGQDLTPVTAKVEDVNGDRKPDLVLFLQDQRLVFINDGTHFRPLKPGEQVTVR